MQRTHQLVMVLHISVSTYFLFGRAPRNVHTFSTDFRFGTLIKWELLKKELMTFSVCGAAQCDSACACERPDYKDFN